MLDIQKLRYFITIVENEFNITKAAQELLVSQPALSNVIRNLECEDDLHLFIKSKGRYIGLTPSGKCLYDEGYRLLHHYENMMQKVRRTSERFVQSISIAAPPFILRAYASRILFSLNRTFPDIEFVFHEVTQEELKKGLLDHHYDIGLMTEPNDYENFGIFKREVDKKYFSVCLSKNHPLANKEILNWEDIVEYPLTLPANRFATYNSIQDAIRSRGLEADIVLAGSVWDFQVTTLIGTDYISLMPEIVENFFTKEMEENLLMIPIRGSVEWTVVYCENMSAPRSEAFQSVREFILENIGQSR